MDMIRTGRGEPMGGSTMNVRLRHSAFLIAIAALFLPGLGVGDVYNERAEGRNQIDDAIALAKKDNKHVLITWGANWCGWCRRLDEIVRTDPTVAKLLRENYVHVKIDIGHRDKNMDLARKYGADLNDLGIPHSTVLDGEGKVVNQIRARQLGDPDDDVDDYTPTAVARQLEANKPVESKTSETAGEQS
jgi:thiol-disulfide isomerase/thioredoxin